MPLLCFIGRHKPGVSSIARGKGGGYQALCDSCGMPLEQNGKSRWKVIAPLVMADRTRHTGTDRSL